MAKKVDDHVGERIRERRAQMGMTQEDLGRALNISYQQVQKYETGANRISAGRLYEIAEQLNVDITYFFADFAEGERNGPQEHGGKNRSTIELARNFADIEGEMVRAAVSGLVKSLAGRRGAVA